MANAVAIVGVAGCFIRLGIANVTFKKKELPKLQLERKPATFIRGYYFAYMVTMFIEYLIFFGLIVAFAFFVGRLLWG